jgi:hypothetical protein
MTAASSPDLAEEPRILPREKRLRRAARLQGYRLVKSRSRDAKAPGHGGYLVIDAERDTVVLGSEPHAFSATLDAVENFLMDGTRPRHRPRAPGSEGAPEGTAPL